METQTPTSTPTTPPHSAFGSSDSTLGKVYNRSISLIGILTLGIPIVLIILSGIAVSFDSCPMLARWIIVFCSVAIGSILLDFLYRNLLYGFFWTSQISYLILNLFLIAWDIYGIYLLAGPGRSCNTSGWSAYNYIVTAVLVAIDLLGSIIFLLVVFKNFFIHPSIKS